MSAVEEIQAAITKLTDLRTLAVSQPLSVYERDSLLVVVGEAEDDDAPILFDVSRAGGSADAHMIVTLYRTIDAQLAILREVVTASTIEQNWVTLVYTETALALARAINGVSA